MANVISWLCSPVSERMSLEKQLRHTVKHGLRGLGLTRSGGRGQQMWKELYKAHKGADKSDLRAAIRQANARLALELAEDVVNLVEEQEPPQQENTAELLTQLQAMLATQGLSAAAKKAVNDRIVAALS